MDDDQGRVTARPNRRRLIAVAAGLVLITGAVVLLRSGVQPPAPPVTGPDGERITAYHDSALVTPPQTADGRPQRPGDLHTDPRRGGVLVSWPPAPYGFEVRWGSAGQSRGQLANVRYVATPGTSLSELRPGRYRIEVRSVDERGRRSQPASAEVDVSADPPRWQQGLGFVEDFTTGVGLGPDRWRLQQLARQTIRREGTRGPILMDGNNGSHLRPTSQLVLGDPDPDGVRGRLVVVADVPRAPVPDSMPVPAPSDVDGPSNDLIVSVAPMGPAALDTSHTVFLRISSLGVFLNIATEKSGEPPAEHRFDVPAAAVHGVSHRWELVFTADRVRLQLDGRPVGEAEFRPPWQRADVHLTSFVTGETLGPTAVRISLVGFTGTAPDGGAIELVELNAALDQQASVQRFTVPAAATAVRARLNGLAINPGPGTHVEAPPPPPELTAEVSGRPVEVQRQVVDHGGSAQWFAVDLPIDVMGSESTVTLRSLDGTGFGVYALELEVTHAPGTVLDVQQPRVERPRQPEVVRPRLVVRNGNQPLSSGQAVPRGRLEVEVVLDPVATQAIGGELVGWVALRADLDDRRILQLPTAVDGPAVTGGFRFTLDTTTLPPGDHLLTVSLVPDRPAVPYGTARFALKLDA